MKKIMLISLVSLALTGCGDDKVTKEYLVGDWRCNINNYERYNSGTNEDFGDLVSSSENIMAFRIIDNDLYQINKKDETKILIDPSKLEININKTTENSKINTKKTMKAVDNDTFKSIMVTEVEKINNNTNIIDFKNKTEATCTRIK